ncbi:MAG: carbon-nitrogen hydrolase family protein [Panacagrimonas sp.]
MSAFLAAMAQFPVIRYRDWAEVEDRLDRWVADATGQGAKLLVFPEYASMSLAALLSPSAQGDLALQLQELQGLRSDWLALHRRLAHAHGVHVLAGSFPWQVEGALRYVNRAWLCSPNGDAQFQDKQIMTRFEREHWGISSGEPARVFATSLGLIGIAICYDSEFPLLVRAQVEAGAEILLVPSCTDAAAGYHRVRIAAQARALESQCHVLMSPLVGEAPWSPAVDVNVGAAGLYGPPDKGFPDDGVIAQGQLNEPGWILGEIDPARMRSVRQDGQVLNWRHWSERINTPAKIVPLS